MGLQVAAAQFETRPEADGVTDVRHGGRATEIASGLQTTVFLFADGGDPLCLVTTHFGPSFPVNLSLFVRARVAEEVGIDISRVLLFTSHNHTSVALAENGVLAYNAYAKPAPPIKLLPTGARWLQQLCEAARPLSKKLQTASVWWCVGRESRITYNRKGRHADGMTYLMREEDRKILGVDFQGDVDTDVPIMVFRNEAGDNVAALVQFTGHPVTAFHPEKTVVFGEWPQIACEIVGAELDAPTGFLQGCAADVNSKEMFDGGVQRSREFGEMLAASCLEALATLQESQREGLDVELRAVSVPLGSLPAVDVLRSELQQIESFIRRAELGDEDTMRCVGQNFARGLSPAYRGWLASQIRPWNQWALSKHETGERAASEQLLEIAAIRIGDVGIVGLPCEPFQNIGRQIRSASELALTIACGYMNVNHGYFPDSENVGDNEYMSAHYRYTKFRAPFRKPAGDVLALAGSEILNQFVRKHD